MQQKPVIYQAFTRLFGNTNPYNKPWGTLEENGVGKFSDFTPLALREIRELGVSHLWLTGVLHHASVTAYPELGIPGDDPLIVKGRAGSPYSVKDYYNVDPDLASDPSRRLEEFEELIDRCHTAGLKVIIDIVPNHVARAYSSLTNPTGVEDFGADDDRSVEYRRDNDFYYVPGEEFSSPAGDEKHLVLGGEEHPRRGTHREFPTRWTGNGSRKARPDINDWYEAVKINFGVRPDGQKDFDSLPTGFDREPCQMHHAFWRDRDIPGSWKKFMDIAIYWLNKGVDGFRYDMAELVPVEFWSYMNSSIKMNRPDALLIAEVYQPQLYRDYIHLGKMDLLYDKVGLYDTLRQIIRGEGSTDWIVPCRDAVQDIEGQLLRFLENHDEQRIAHSAFAGDACKGKSAMVVSACLGPSATLIYFGQECGEKANEDAGFGSASRTTIFDYGSVPSHLKWVNGGHFDGGKLSREEMELRDFYKRILNFRLTSRALTGEYMEIHSFNRSNTRWYNDRVFSFARWSHDEKLIIIVNFHPEDSYGFELGLPGDLCRAWRLSEGQYLLEDQLDEREQNLYVNGNQARTRIDILPLDSLILKCII